MAGRPKSALTKREALELFSRINRLGFKYPTGSLHDIHPKAATVLAWRLQVVTGNDPSATLAFGKVTSSQFPDQSEGNHPYVLTSDGTIIDHGSQYNLKRGRQVYWGNPPKDDFGYTWIYGKSPKLTKDFEGWAEEFRKVNPKLDETIKSQLEAYRYEKTPEYKASKQAEEHRNYLAGRFQALALSLHSIVGPFEAKDLEQVDLLAGAVATLKAEIETALGDVKPKPKAAPKRMTVKAK